MLKLITDVTSATFLLLLFMVGGANAESRLPPCPKDRSVSWNNCHGTVSFTDGVEYVGEFKDGKLDGQGTQTIPDGRKYVGEFRDGKPNGQGTLTFPEGGKYGGEWKDGQSTGLGTLTWPDGVEYVGDFKDNKYNGQGTLTWPDGRKYSGGFKDGKRNGPGTLYPSDGSVIQSGIWKNETLVEPSAEYSSNKAIAPTIGLPEKTDGYLPPIILSFIIAGCILIVLFKIFPATELQDAQRPQQKITKAYPVTGSRENENESKLENDFENGPRPVSDAEMDVWRAPLEPPRPHLPEQVVQQPSPISVSKPANSFRLWNA